MKFMGGRIACFVYGLDQRIGWHWGSTKIHKFSWLYVLIRWVLFFFAPLHHEPGQHFNALFARQAFGAKISIKPKQETATYARLVEF